MLSWWARWRAWRVVKYRTRNPWPGAIARSRAGAYAIPSARLVGLWIDRKQGVSQ
jgi:hypothetical protein